MGKYSRQTARTALLATTVLAVCLPVTGHARQGDALRPASDVRGGATARVPLSPETNAVFAKLGAEALDNPASGRVPNYLRAMATTNPAAVVPFAHLFKTVVFGGTVAPEIKAAMGLQIAHSCGSNYLAAHLTRILATTEKGKAFLSAPNQDKTGDKRAAVALRYGMHLTGDVHGVSDAEFATARSVYNDAQLVELTVTTCFFNYFARYCQGAGLPQEAWVKDAPNALPTVAENRDLARVGLASDAELKVAAEMIAPPANAGVSPTRAGLGIGIANSQRAMMRVPDLSSAWWDFGKAVREDAQVGRDILLQVSFAVSMANGCRYCTVHQVVGLRRLGVDPAKLIAMKKDDSALTPKEKAAVEFARRLTKSPGDLNDADFAALRREFPTDREAMDILLQTCMFSFMNRFTDGLRLPSEDEAVKVYQEVYGDGSYAAYPYPRTPAKP